MGFSSSHLYRKWRNIPEGIDILVTHMPPLSVLDLAWARHRRAGVCRICGNEHEQYRHWGCPNLLETVRLHLEVPHTR